MDKNILIAEILYTIFCHHKSHGKRYKKRQLISEMSLSGQLAELLYKESLSEEDTALIRRALDTCQKYTSVDLSGFDLGDLNCEPISETRPADMMRDIIRAIITEGRKTFRNDIVIFYLFAIHNLPRVYMSNTVAYLGHINGHSEPEEAIEWSVHWLDKVKKKYQ